MIKLAGGDSTIDFASAIKRARQQRDDSAEPDDPNEESKYTPGCGSAAVPRKPKRKHPRNQSMFAAPEIMPNGRCRQPLATNRIPRRGKAR